MTSPMTPEQYAQIQHEFLAVRDLTGVERDLRLQEIAGRLPDAMESIERLLATDLGNDDFLEVPLVDRDSRPEYATTNITDGVTDSVEHPEFVGPFRILQKIGEGGHGLVFMAEQHAPIRRRVAVKWIKPGMDSSLVLARFEAERQALAMMSHPSIANVIDAGRTEMGQPYFVMELVHGEPIDQFCERNELGLEERLQVFCQVCDAVHHAHRKGIIHRDIKPSNVLVTVDSGQPLAKVIDFGIAKALHMPLTEKTMFTEYGQILGTLEYMSPEQAMMSQSGIDVRSDVYSLGVLLYVLITGQTPLNKQQLLKEGLFELRNVLQQVQPQTPSLKITTSSEGQRWRDHADSPESWAKSVQGDLDWITMKALAKQPNQRYDSAAEFALDLQQFIAGEVVLARPPSRIYLFQKWFARHRVMATTSTALLACVLISTVTLWWAFTKSQDNLLQANEARAIVKVQSQQLEQSLNVSRQETARADYSAKKLSGLLQKQRIESAWNHAMSGDYEAASEQLGQVPPGQAEIESMIVSAVANQMKLPMLRHSSSGTIRRLVLHQASGTLAVLNARSELELYDLLKGQPRRLFSVPNLIYSACQFSHDGNEIMLASRGGLIKVDLSANRVEAAVQVTKSSIRSLIHDAVHGQWVFTTGVNFAHFVDEESLRQTVAVDLGTRVDNVVLTSSSRHVLVVALDGRLLAIPADDPSQIASIMRGPHQITHVEVNDRAVILVDANGTVQKIHNERFNDLKYDGSNLYSNFEIAEILTAQFDISPKPVDVAFASDGAMLLANGGGIRRRRMDGVVVPVHDFSAKIKNIISSFTTDELLAVLPSGKILKLPSSLIRSRLSEFRLLPDLVDAVSDAGGSTVVTATSDGQLQRWSRKTMTLITQGQVHDSAIFQIDVHTGTKMVASVGENRQLVISNAVNFEPQHRMKVGWGVRCVQFSEGGHLLAAAPDATNTEDLREGTIDLWNTKTGAASIRLVGHENWVLKAEFSSDDQTLATLAFDETARLWSTATGEMLAVIRLVGLSKATSMALRPDAAVLVIGHEDGSLSTWDSSTGELLRQDQLASDQIMSLQFIEGAARLLAVARSQDGLIIADPSDLESAVRLPVLAGDLVQARIDRTSGSVQLVTSSGRVFFWNW